MRSDVPEAFQGRGARFVRRHPLIDELANAHFEVKGELGVHLPLHRDAPEPPPELASEPAQHWHVSASRRAPWRRRS